MMNRYSELAGETVQDRLQRLLDLRDDPKAYSGQMRALGVALGHSLVPKVDAHRGVLVVCTVEDADTLTRGILSALETQLSSERLHVACFWNRREKVGDLHRVSISPIIRRYVEPFHADSIGTVIITGSIISGACVVRTNLMEVLATVKPANIFVVAPVILRGAPERLAEEFPVAVSKQFSYFYFAEDSARDAEGMVDPGIGGDVYQLLGFQSQDDKNAHRPDLVRERSKALRST